MNFNDFPKVNYELDNLGNRIVLTDVTRGVKISETGIGSSSFYKSYRVQDGMRPDTVSQLLYGRPDYHWTIFVANQQLKSGMAAWPLSDAEFERYIIQKYDDWAVMSFYPKATNSPTSITFGDVALTTRFLPYLYIYPSSFPTHFAKIDHYDWSRCQLWVSNTLIGTSNVELFISESTGEYKLHIDPSAPGDVLSAWYALGLGDKILTLAPGGYSKALSKYAPYQYTEQHVLENGVETLDAYTAITSLSPSTFVTYLEAEDTLNQGKTFITVVDPAKIVKFVQQYTSIIRL